MWQEVVTRYLVCGDTGPVSVSNSSAATTSLCDPNNIYFSYPEKYVICFHYRPQGKVMFSEASVSHSVHGGWGGGEGSIMSLPVCSNVLYRRGVSAPRGYLLPGEGVGMASWYWHLVAAIAAVRTHPTEMSFLLRIKVGRYVFISWIENSRGDGKSDRDLECLKSTSVERSVISFEQIECAGLLSLFYIISQLLPLWLDLVII